MPLGSRQNNNFLHLIMDVWRDQIFFNETVYPTGHFAAELLNVPEETMRELVTHGGAISHQGKALALVGRSEFIKLLDGTRTSLEKLLDALWRCPPYSLMDKGQELHTLEVLFSPASHNDLLKLDSPAREFFLRYLVAAFSIPLGIQHFAVAARYFEEGYLRRLKKRTETYFAMAAHDCFNSEWFWSMMRDLPVPDIEPFTITPELRSSYVFARHPKQEKETVFVNRYFFDHVISFYIFDLMNGLQHGHAPSRCCGCGTYFLTTNGYMPKYCDGIAPQDPRMTCRQYGAMMRQKEQNKQHPVYRLFTTRTNTIRKHQRSPMSCAMKRCMWRRACGIRHSWTTTMPPAAMPAIWSRKRSMPRRERALPGRKSREYVPLRRSLPKQRGACPADTEWRSAGRTAPALPERGIPDHAGRKLLRAVFSGLSGGRPQAGGCAGTAGRGAAV